MDGSYWLVEADRAQGPELGCVYGFSAADAAEEARRLFGEDAVIGSLKAVQIEWFHYEPVLAPSRKLGGREMASLRDQFYSGGRIGCEVDGVEIMFTPDLLPEPKETGTGDDSKIVYGNAIVRVRDRPDLDATIELEGLDDAHLLDRLSGEAVLTAGKARTPSVPSGFTAR